MDWKLDAVSLIKTTYIFTGDKIQESLSVAVRKNINAELSYKL